jgi:hypothetical protein
MNKQQLIEDYTALYHKMLAQNNLEGASSCLDKITALQAIPEAKVSDDGRTQLNG